MVDMLKCPHFPLEYTSFASLQEDYYSFLLLLDKDMVVTSPVLSACSRNHYNKQKVYTLTILFRGLMRIFESILFGLLQ